MVFQIKMFFLLIGIFSCHIYGQKNEFSDCMQCINLKDSLLTTRCFDTLKNEYTKLEKMSLHYNFCLDSALAYLSLKNELSSIEKEMIEYLRTGCQDFSDEYQLNGLCFMTRDSFYLYKDNPFPVDIFLSSGCIALSIGVTSTIMSINNLNQLKRKNYEWDLINAKSIDKTIGIIFVALACIVDAGGIGLTTIGTIKKIQENNKLSFLKNVQLGNKKIKVIVDY